MNKVTLNARQRMETGKGPARRLRAAGQAPAIFYGKKTEPMNLAVQIHEFHKAVEKAGSNPLFDLRISTDGDTETTMIALLKERQIRPVDSSLVHLDFVQVFMDEPIEVDVPLEFVGKAIGVEKGGMFQTAAKEIRVSCLPADIPDEIVVDISQLERGHSIHVGQITLPEGVKPATDLGIALATVVAPKKEDQVEAEVPEEPAK
ncbi:MAG: 50S ribosomal protein L25 [Deltaproteobacteria bacterium]|nr:50S ribosomal protein L25 [Deltaproteobacteria bacterium]